MKRDDRNSNKVKPRSGHELGVVVRRGSVQVRFLLVNNIKFTSLRLIYSMLLSSVQVA